MTRVRLITASVVLVGLGCGVTWWAAGRVGPALGSEAASGQSAEGKAESSGAPTPWPHVAARPPPHEDRAKIAEAPAATNKGRSLFEDRVLLPPELPASTAGARERADQAAQAQALGSRAERRLARMREMLSMATGERKQRLQIVVESLERNLEHRRQREMAAPRSSLDPSRP